MSDNKEIIKVSNLNLFYGKFHALIDVDMNVEKNKITALIGPSGCGKSTLLRCLNRMNDLIRSAKVTGSILLDNVEIISPDVEVAELRKKVGMVFQRPNPFPLSIWENVTYGLKVAGIRNKSKLNEIAERSLKGAWMWDQVKDKLNYPALELPLDQQQRLCIARLLAVQPDVILMDEPCSSLDPIATMKIEELMIDLKKDYTIAIVTHNMQQASRVSDYTGYMLLGEMIEFDDTKRIFTNPANKLTEEYISGKYG
jgi:phosphate transport system ATP-binding protein